MSRPCPARVVLDSAVSERQFQDSVIELATRLGWMWYCVPDSRRCPAGWPDLVLCRPPVVLFVECKTDKGRIRPEQREWLEALSRCDGVEARVWRPRNWPEIVDTLTGVADEAADGSDLG